LESGLGCTRRERRTTAIGRTKLYEIIKADKLETWRAEGMTVILRNELQRYLYSLPSAGGLKRR
jgi:hypothetical protein